LRYALPIYPKDALYSAAKIYNLLLGGLSLSRLFQVVREEHGLCYSISSHYQADYGIIDIQVAFDAKNETLLRHLIDQEIARIAQEGVDEVELERAITYLSSQYRQEFDSSITVINHYLSRDLIHEPFFSLDENISIIRNVKLEAVQQVAAMMKKSMVFYVKQREGRAEDEEENLS
jgi:predicted Zn-dependent peptidase